MYMLNEMIMKDPGYISIYIYRYRDRYRYRADRSAAVRIYIYTSAIYFALYICARKYKLAEFEIKGLQLKILSLPGT
jgi:hypothetical protein